MGLTNCYEEERRLRLEENKRRMEELNLTGLATSLIQASNTASKSAQRPSNPRKQRTEGSPVLMRRSSRVANIPAPNYREEAFDIPHLRKGYSRRSLIPHAIASIKASREAAEHGFKIESDLGSTYPTFVKPMLHSHISGGFWLGLPSDFCKAHMPKQNSRMILEESGDDYETLYLAAKVGLSAGWRGFSIHHGLIEGDCLVFQLIQPTRFKVFIIRSADFESGKKRYSENESDSVQEQLSQEFEDESDAVQELPMTGKQKRSSEDGEEASSESVEADGKLSKKPKKTPKVLVNAKGGKQQSKKSGKKPSHNSDGEEHEKQQHTGSTDANDSQVPDDEEDSNKRTAKATAAPKSRSKKQINSMMPTRKTTRSEKIHIKPSNGRVTVAA